jgi:hypothetical protein
LPALRQLLFLRTEHLLADRTDFFEQSLAETLPDTLRYLDAQAVAVHKDSLSPRQLAAVRHVFEDVLQLAPADFDDALRYVVPRERAGDGVFLARDDRWTVTSEAETSTTLARIDDAAAVTVYNIAGQPKQVELLFSLAPESEGSLLVTAESTVLFDAAPAAQAVIRIVLTVPMGATVVDFSNRLPGPVIIKNPQLIVR